MRWRPGAWLGLALALSAAPGRADMQAIGGTLTVAPGLAHHVGPDDRLILKLYHPEGGVEMLGIGVVEARRLVDRLDRRSHPGARLGLEAAHGPRGKAEGFRAIRHPAPSSPYCFFAWEASHLSKTALAVRIDSTAIGTPP